MKYMGMPWGMWTLFAGSFQAQLTDVLGYNEQTAKAITRRAKAKYKEILSRLPEFEKGDRFKINLVGCAMLGAFVLTMPERPNVDRLTEYYAKAMMTKPMRWFCRKSGEKKFTPQSVAGLQAAGSAEGRRPEPLFVEHGLLRVPRRQRLQGPVYQVRYLRFDAGAGAVRFDSGPVPSGLHHERSGRHGRF